MKASDIKSITNKVTKNWTKQRKREERSPSARMYRNDYVYSNRINQTDVAWSVIPKAYEKASSGGKLPAHARQIYYAARKEIEDRTGRPLGSEYFTQTLLPRYIYEHSYETAKWWVVYDARGHLIEPHSAERKKAPIPVGTLEVDKHLRDIALHRVDALDASDAFDIDFPTCGPANRYSAILYIEKEGFNPLFKKVRLAERYDIAIMSNKGQSVVAGRHLVDELCGDDVPVLVLHDFDKYGFLISQNLTSVSDAARKAERVRYHFKHKINVIDLGLRLEDVEKYGLESETHIFTGGFGADSIATPEEQEFLRGDQRVELNAFASADFIEWIEGKLQEHGIKKVVPGADVLEQAYRRAYQTARVNQRLEDINTEASEEAEGQEIPGDLEASIREALESDPARSWDAVLAEIAGAKIEDNQDD